MAATPEAHGTLYRYYDADGQLLYIGKTKRGRRRIHEHVRSASWFEKAAKATFERVPLADLDKRETAAILDEQPRYNRAGRGPAYLAAMADSLATARDQLRVSGEKECCIVWQGPEDRAYVFQVRRDDEPGQVPPYIVVDTSDEAKFNEFLRAMGLEPATL